MDKKCKLCGKILPSEEESGFCKSCQRKGNNDALLGFGVIGTGLLLIGKVVLFILSKGKIK